jgi:hypothetical protein
LGGLQSFHLSGPEFLLAEGHGRPLDNDRDSHDTGTNVTDVRAVLVG